MKWPAFLIFSLTVLSAEVRADTAASSIQGTTVDSEIYGTAVFEDTAEGLAAEVEIFGAPPGDHGIHIHEFGNCLDKGLAAGGHFDPDKSPHGFLPKDGLKSAHAGDFGNIKIDRDGRGILKLTVADLKVAAGTYGVEGRSIILHELPDDFGQPTGNAGSRIACGTIRIEK